MITVNLLPNEFRPVKHSPAPYIAGIALFLFALFVIMSMFFGAQARIASARDELEAKKTEFAALEDVVLRYNELSEQKKELEVKVQIIKDILSDRIIWSEHLHRLASLTPKNIWYRRIRVTWQSFKEQQIKKDPRTGNPVLDQRTKQPQMEMTTVQRPVLEISGYVIADEQGERQISPLLDKTTEPGSEFAKDFTLLRPRIEDTEFKGFSVRGFTLEYLIESGA